MKRFGIVGLMHRDDVGLFVPVGIRTTNHAEIRVAQDLEADGWKVYKRGWPDFMAVKDGKLRFIEVKPREISKLSGAQMEIAELLMEHFGIEVERVVPSGPPRLKEQFRGNEHLQTYIAGRNGTRRTRRSKNPVDAQTC